MSKLWKNWSGSAECRPTHYAEPENEAQLQALVQEARAKGHTVRVVGSGHSFTPLVPTGQVLVSLDGMQGLVNVAGQEATAWGGTKLHALGEALFAKGLAQENLGDIDVQSIAGAISTGTHGTGTAFGSIATQTTALQLVNGLGEVVNCSASENPEHFKAAQVSLGALGIISQLTLRTVPSYTLEFTTGKESLDEVLAHYPQYNQENRNFEFYWFPHTNTVQTKFSNTTDKPAKEGGFGQYITDIVLENHVFQALSYSTRLIPRLSAPLARLSAAVVSTSAKVNHSHRVYATPRYVKFNEMEYNIPATAFTDVVQEVRRCIAKHKFRVHFPLEYRFVKADDLWLSPAYGRDSAYIACHVYKGKPYKEYFARLEEIFVAHGGRPHWGKLHTRTAASLEKVYPKWNEWLQVRRQMDPDGVFLNTHLKQLFGL